MNWIDFIILIIVILFAAEGLRKGFFSQIFNIIGFVIALVSALTFYPLIAKQLTSLFDLPKIAANPIGFLIVWLITETLFFGLITRLFRNLLNTFSNNKVNKYLGFIPASINALLFLSFVLLFAISLPIRPDIKQDIFDAKIGSYLVEKVTALEKPLNSVFGPITKQGLTFLTIRPEDKGSIDLQFTQNQLSRDSQSEQAMLELINSERVNNGSLSLKWDEALAQIAGLHSQDMFLKGYFSHFSPEGSDVGDRLLGNGIQYSYAGENLALAPNVQRAHVGLMNSEGHRRNILDPAFRNVGIGVVDGGVYGKMFTQVFTE